MFSFKRLFLLFMLQREILYLTKIRRKSQRMLESTKVQAKLSYQFKVSLQNYVNSNAFNINLKFGQDRQKDRSIIIQRTFSSSISRLTVQRMYSDILSVHKVTRRPKDILSIHNETHRTKDIFYIQNEAHCPNNVLSIHKGTQRPKMLTRVHKRTQCPKMFPLSKEEIVPKVERLHYSNQESLVKV
ncbi:hypothetical protein CR513_32591, partial [Mucuna pruriens]